MEESMEFESPDEKLFCSDSEGYNLLCCAIKSNKVEDAEKLLDRGCPVNCKDQNVETPLHYAMRKANLSLVKNLLNRGASVNAKDQIGFTALHLSVKYGHTSLVRLLLEKGAFVDGWEDEEFENHPNRAVLDGRTPLFLAVEKSRNDIVEILLQNNANVNKINKDQVTPLLIACKFGNYETCELLLKFRARPGFIDPFGRSLLHISVKRNCYKTTELLLNYKADVNLKNFRDRKAPLHIASENKNKNMCELLLRFKAEVDVLDIFGKTALRIAIEKDDCDITELLLQNNADIKVIGLDQVLRIAAHANVSKQMWELLLKCGAQVSASESPNSLLCYVVQKDRLDIAELLLLNKADVNQFSAYGTSPLYVACTNENISMCELLLRFNADPNLAKFPSHTPLYISVWKCNFEIVLLLLENGADPNMISRETTPIFTAISRGDVEICELLLKFGASTLVVDQNFKSALYCATRSGNVEIVEVLVKYGAAINEEIDGCNFLHIATSFGDEAMFALFLKYGVKIDITEKNGQDSIVHLAVRNGCYEIVNSIFEQSEVTPKDFPELLKIAVQQKSENCRRIAQYLLGRGFQVNEHLIIDTEFITSVVENNYVEFFSDALKLGLDVNMPVNNSHDFCSCSLLHVAIKNKRQTMAEQILIHGGNVDVADCDDTTPLFYAVKKACFEYEQKKALENASNFEEIREDLELVEFLLKWGSDLERTNEEGSTPLHIIVSSGYVHLLKLLIRYNANLNSVDKNGASAFLLACMKLNKEILQLLLKNGSDMNVTDNNNLSVFDYLEETSPGYWESARFLQEHVIKLKAADLCHNGAISNLPTNLISSDFKKKCEVEIAAMKSDVVGDSCVSFYDLLTCSVKEFVRFMGVENFLSILENHGWKSKYPVFEGWIYYKLIQAERIRQILLEFAAVAVLAVPFIVKLPDLCMFKIINYFTRQDIFKLICLHKTTV